MRTDWKSNVGNYLSGKGSFRLEYLKKQLAEWIKEYINYLNEFKGINTKVSNYKEIKGKTFLHVVEVYLNTIDPGSNAPFIIGLDYDNNGDLTIIYSTDFSFNKDIKNFFFEDEKAIKEDNYNLQEDLIKEPEKTEKEYVLQIINQRLSLYFDNLNKQN